MDAAGKRILTSHAGGTCVGGHVTVTGDVKLLDSTGKRILALWTSGACVGGHVAVTGDVQQLDSTGKRILALQTGGTCVGGHVAVTGDGVPLLHTATPVGARVVVTLRRGTCTVHITLCIYVLLCTARKPTMTVTSQ